MDKNQRQEGETFIEDGREYKIINGRKIWQIMPEEEASTEEKEYFDKLNAAINTRRGYNGTTHDWLMGM